MPHVDSSRRPRIAVVGDAGWDLTFVLRAAPGDEKAEVRKSTRSLGGTGANAAAVTTRLGAFTQLVATVGTDPIGAVIEDAARRVVTEVEVAQVDGPSEVAVITIAESGHRTVLVDIGVAESYEREAAVRAARAADWTYLSAVSPGLVAGVVAGARNTPAVVSLEARHLAADWQGILARCAVLVTNAAGRRGLHNITLPPIVCITRGAAGVELSVRGRTTVVAPPVVREVDGTGAGDAFGGALVVLLAGGLDPERAVRLAAAAGALVASHVGAQTFLPTRDEIERAAV